MKKIKALFLCLLTAVLFAAATGCSGQNNKETTGTTSAASPTTDSEMENPDIGRDESAGENSGAGSTGSTEGETGVLEGLMDDVEEGAGEIYDKGRDAVEEGRDKMEGETAARETANP